MLADYQYSPEQGSAVYEAGKINSYMYDVDAEEVTEIAQKYLHRIDKSKVASIAYWNSKRKEEVEASAGTKLGSH